MCIHDAGINQCTRALEKAYKTKSAKSSSTPLLILLARDVRPATILAHIPTYAKALDIPTLILPGKASTELGKSVGIKSVACAIFLSSCSNGEESKVSSSEDDAQKKEDEWKEAQADVDSFVKYVISKIPPN